jgi:hypothetical protein
MEKLFCERVCYRCGKEFIVPDRASWLYKRNLYNVKGDRTKYFCSYKCISEWDKARKHNA